MASEVEAVLSDIKGKDEKVLQVTRNKVLNNLLSGGSKFADPAQAMHGKKEMSR